MDKKFLGVGLTNAIGLWALFLIFSLMAKVVLNIYPIEGLTEVVNVGA